MADDWMHDIVRFIEHACEFAGVFLLSVEAIKVENLKSLSQHVLRPTLSRLNPRIEFVDERKADGSPATDDSTTIWLVFVALIFLGLVELWWLMRHFTPALVSTIAGWWRAGWVAAIGVAVIGLFVCALVGLATWTLMIIVLTGATTALENLERAVHRGIIGIVGFGLFAVYWMLKIVAE